MTSTPIKRVRVAVVEDDADFLDTLAAAVDATEDLQMVASAGTRQDGLRMLEQRPADVLVVDLGLPDGSGIDVIRAAGLRWPACMVMVSTTFGDEAHVMRSIEAGATGYLLKHGAAAGLAEAIRSICDGGSPISPLIARQVLNRFRSAAPPLGGNLQAEQPTPGASHAVSLSPREREVLNMVTKGFTADEIAKLMQLSSHTVLTFIRRIYRKLKVNSKAEAIYEARAQGLLA